MDNQSFLNKLYLENRTALALFIHKQLYSKNCYDAEDCLQETFLIVIRKVKAGGVENHPNITGWLYSIAKNVANKFNETYVKKNAKSADVDADLIVNRADFTEQILEDIVYSEVDRDRLLMEIIEEMTVSEREIFELKQRNLGNKEIAGLLNKSESTVKSTYSRLKPKIKRIIGEKL